MGASHNARRVHRPDRAFIGMPIVSRSTRYAAGVAVLVLFQLAPLAIPFVWMTGMSVTVKSVLSALLALGIPEIGVLLAIALLGRREVRRIWRRTKRCLKQLVT